MLGQFALPNASDVQLKRRQVLHCTRNRIPRSQTLLNSPFAKTGVCREFGDPFALHLLLETPSLGERSAVTHQRTRARRLFRNIGWSFLVDSVRVRPLHEEMTARLLEEVEKRRAQKTVRSSTAREPPGFASAVLAATAADAATPPQTGVVVAATTAGTTSGRPTVGGRLATTTAAASTPGSATASAAACTVGSHHPGAAARTEQEAGSIRAPVADAADRFPSVEDGRVEAAETGGEAAAAAAAAAAAMKLRVEAERRQVALATIEKHRSHRHTVPAAAGVATAGGPAALSHAAVALEHSAATRSGATMSTARADSCTSSHAGVAAAAGKPSLSMSTAFSRQSVRSGETLGFYGREEVSVLSAISKNPSRIAAYNRITEGKAGHIEDGPSPEVRPARSGVSAGCQGREKEAQAALEIKKSVTR